MVKYYWHRYSVKKITNYAWGTENTNESALTNATNVIPYLGSDKLFHVDSYDYGIQNPNSFPIDGFAYAVTDGSSLQNKGTILNRLRVKRKANGSGNNNVLYGTMTTCYAQNCTISEIQGEYLATIQAEEAAYVNNAKNNDGFWYVRAEKVNTAPNFTQIPTQSTKKDAITAINLVNYFSDAQGDVLTYAVSSSNPSVAKATVSGETLTMIGKEIGSTWITIDANDGELTTTQGFQLNVINTAPTVSVSSPSSNVTLYENDLFNLTGSATDVNANQSVTIYAQVNFEQRIVLNIGLSNAAIPFNKQLKFAGGKIFDGDTPITGNLTDGIPHTLKIWAQDGDGAQSAINERTFYVVPNRPPVLTVDTVVPSGIINTDKFTISGTAGDPDGNPITAGYRLNGGNSVVLEVNDGRWEFDITLAQLSVGENTIVIELFDSYNFKVSKTVKLNKNEVKTPILHSVARYKIEPPRGTATGVLLYLQRDEDLTDLTVELSMTIAGEQEHYEILTSDNTAPVSDGVVEDEFYFEADEPKNHIILKLSTTRADIAVDQKIHLISGVVE